MNTVWCVEDDASVREIELYTLRSTGYQAKGFPNGEAFLEALKAEQPDLVLLDVMLPGMDGVEVLKRVRSSPKAAGLPVIMATAKGMEYDKVQSLDLGADDYLVKPFGMMEMVSRIKAVLRRSVPAAQRRTLGWGGLVMDLDSRTVTADGKQAELTYKEFEVLRRFLAHPRTVFSRDQLMAEVWGSEYLGETRTVDVHIRTLRQKLGAYGDQIKTVRNVGYRFDPEEA